jgi:hypothetical protein
MSIEYDLGVVAGKVDGMEVRLENLENNQTQMLKQQLQSSEQLASLASAVGELTREIRDLKRLGERTPCDAEACVDSIPAEASSHLLKALQNRSSPLEPATEAYFSKKQRSQARKILSTTTIALGIGALTWLATEAWEWVISRQAHQPELIEAEPQNDDGGSK